jgi:phage-related protein
VSLNINFSVGLLDKFTRPMQNFEKQMNGVTKSFEGIKSVGDNSFGALQGTISDTVDQFKQYKTESAAIKNSFVELGQSTDQFIGKTGEFMSALKDLGKEKKALKDNFVANNELMRVSFFESVGSMLARSTQSEKIAANFERMGNPLYSVNNGLLKVSGALEGIAKRGAPAVLALKQLGPTASMKELNDHTRMINQGIMRMGAVALVAGAGFVLATGKMIDRAYELNSALGPLTEQVKSTWSTAFDPLARVVGKITEGFLRFTNKVGELINRFNEANPVLATALQTFGWLTLGLTALLSPLAIGIGLFGGLQAALYAVWAIISPFVVGLASVVGTAALVSAAIVGIGAALYLAYTKVSWFRDGVNAAWEWIKNASAVAFSFIKNVVITAIGAIVSFGGEQLAKFKALWSEHGSAIVSFVKNSFSNLVADIKIAMSLIETVFRTVWPIIEGLTKITWGILKMTIGSAIDIIVGLIDAGMSLLQGDWSGAWSAIKGIAEDIWHNIEDFFRNIDLVEIGKDIIRGLINGIGSMKRAVGDKIRAIANSIPAGIKKLLGIHSPSRVMMAIGKFIPQGLELGIGKGINGIKRMASTMASATVPNANGTSLSYGLSSGGTSGGSGTTTAASSASDGNSSHQTEPQYVIVNIAGHEARGTIEYITQAQDRAKNRKERARG